MFTGIVTAQGHLLAVENTAGNTRLRIACPWKPGEIALGASIACNGICLTVIERGEESGPWFAVDASPQTVAVTTLGDWQTGDRLNLERALRLGDELGGHFVSGHVDGIAVVEARNPNGASVDFTLRAPADLTRFIAPKGSVTLDGTSLTVTWAKADRFGLTLIPHSLNVTGWGRAQPGQRMNLEIDLMARYAARLKDME